MAALILIRAIQAADFAARALLSHAESMRRYGRFAEAEPLYQRGTALPSCAGDTRCRSSARPLVGRVFNNSGSLREGTGHYEGARVLSWQALEITEKSSAQSSQRAGILCNIAVCAMDRGRYRDAEPYLLRTMRIEEASPSQDGSTLSVLENYALVLRKTRRGSYGERASARIAVLRQGRSRQ